MDLTIDQIKEIIFYGTLDKVKVCDLELSSGLSPHLDWSLRFAFEELSKHTIWDGKQVESFLWKRIESLIKVVNETNKTSRL